MEYRDHDDDESHRTRHNDLRLLKKLERIFKHGCNLGEADLAVWIELLQIHVLVRQPIEPRGAQERFRRLDQQDGLGKPIVVEAAAEVDAALDGEGLELGGVEAELAEVVEFDHLDEIGADAQHVAAAEVDVHPALPAGAAAAGADAVAMWPSPRRATSNATTAIASTTAATNRAPAWSARS